MSDRESRESTAAPSEEDLKRVVKNVVPVSVGGADCIILRCDMDGGITADGITRFAEGVSETLGASVMILPAEVRSMIVAGTAEQTAEALEDEASRIRAELASGGEAS